MTSSSPRYKMALPQHALCDLWRALPARLFGERIEDRAGPWFMEAYLYKGTYYITEYRRRFA